MYDTYIISMLTVLFFYDAAEISEEYTKVGTFVATDEFISAIEK